MLKTFCFLSLATAIVYPQPSHAVLRIDITQGKIEPLPVAITDPVAGLPSDSQMGNDIMNVVKADLKRSGLIAPIDKGAFIEHITSINTYPNFPSWKRINANALVTSSISTFVDKSGEPAIKMEFRLWDTNGEKQLDAASQVTKRDNWRRLAHKIADSIYSKLTGEQPYFDSRIVYIAESVAGNRKVKRLAIMDQDGANHRLLTGAETLVLTPRFSPTTHQITYLSYANNTPRVYLLDTFTGRQRLVGDFPGMTFAPRFSPDGKSIVMSVADHGNSDIYSMNLATGQRMRLTSSPAIDTSPSYSPDGKQIVFNSDRGGSPQLYVMSASGGNQTRISFGNGTAETPVWSPRGDLIAFTKRYQGDFYIGVMRPDGSGERLITRGFLVEGPTWAPNGRVLMFTREERNRGNSPNLAQLYSIDLTGNFEQRVEIPYSGSDPAWSPLLPN
ncbi:MAG: Tol-Pal system protein TolB [Alphaproteobacteria bacterium]|nr:Tol-Pal system protein TolB [Alphaproteobacteria bacterium]